MTVFGKSLSEYLRFERGVLWLVLVVGLLRLGLSMAGAPKANVSAFSLTVLVLGASIYLGVHAQATGFGSYRRLLPLVFFPNVLAHAIAILGIAVAAVTGQENIFTAPEFGGASSTTQHVIGHAVVGAVVAPLFNWGVASLSMLVSRRLGTGRTAGRAAA